MQLHQPRLKINRAALKIDEAKHALGSTGIHRFVARTDAETGESFIRLRLFDVNDIVHVIVGEAAYQLRSALDVAAVALARANGAADVRRVAFPFAKTQSEFSNKGIQGKMNGLSQRVKDVIASFAPYRGGNELLHGLSDLCNTDKHNNLIGSIAEIGNVTAFHPSANFMDDMSIGAFAGRFASAMIDNGNRASDGLEFKLKPDDDDAEQIATMMTKKMRLRVGLLFSETDNLDGCEVFRTLSDMVGLVGSIIQKLEEAS
ncbi:hypothetical protein [Rhizobium hidalgonense]|uniref:hypothetical protein n=1 Tax=Rhizobium hidalgonense TaxID=1538159 RepID=UPI0011058977|nr:hypothetical protein [Rhizobium hidalgonense]QKK24692.1 hypothetical protein FFM81_015695 [Rhizobium hidalgonense]